MKPKTKTEDKLLDIQPVTLKNGQSMFHFKENDGRHIFFANPVMMSWWTMAMLIFILITSILSSIYTAMLITESANRTLEALNVCQTQGLLTVRPSGEVVGVCPGGCLPAFDYGQ